MTSTFVQPPRAHALKSTGIPFVDLNAQYVSMQSEIDEAIAKVIRSHAFIQGPFVAEFEQAFAVAHGLKHAIGCSNGTVALEVALRCLGIGEGDEVITVANTFFATAEAILNVGAMPVFVDIDPQSYGMDPTAAAKAITSHTRALLPVHLFGVPCQLDELCAIASREKLFLIEDAAQAHLASYHGRMVGSFGDAATFSFYPGKNLGAYGDAGLITMSNAELADRARRFVNHGRISKYDHDLIGTNYRIDGIQAAILTAKLRHLNEWTTRRRAVALTYDERLLAAGFKVIRPPAEVEAVYHLYVVEASNRDEVVAHLAAHGVQTGIHYPIPIHHLRAVADLPCSNVVLPSTEHAADRILSLPIYAELALEGVHMVCNLFLDIAKP